MRYARVGKALVAAILWSGWMVAVAQELEPEVRYDGNRVVRVQVNTPMELMQLLAMTDDVWSHVVDIGAVDVRMTPEQYERLLRSGLQHDVLIEDVQKLIDEERARLAAGGADDPSWFTDFKTYDQINARLDYYQANYPALATVTPIGMSFENRVIKAIRVTGPGSSENRPAFLLNGTQHAREWGSPMTVMWFVDNLIEKYGTDPRITKLMDTMQFLVVPVTNPDGYIYTWGPDRMWRKNRRTPPSGSTCYGVDLNRNWGYQWNSGGSSSDPCSETYHGTAAFSEPELIALRDFALQYQGKVKVHIDMHTYSQLVLSPWGYTCATTPANLAEYNQLGKLMTDAIFNTHGKTYVYGPGCQTLYQASGCAKDWGHGTLGALAWTIELRDTGNYGFIMPPQEIIPTGEEILEALTQLCEAITIPVKINLPNGPPALQSPCETLKLTVNVTNGIQTVDPNSVTLFARVGSSGPFTAYPASALGGGNYEVTFPARSCGADTEWYISAAGLEGGVSTLPATAPNAVYKLPVGTLTVVFSDNFETDKGWTVSNQNLTAGAWVRADPVGTTSGGQPAQPEDDNPAGLGTFCFVTQNGTPGGQAGAADVDGGPTRVLSPLLQLAGTDPTIEYYRWMFTSTNDDVLVVEVSNDNGSSWTTVTSIGHANAWNKDSFRLADFVTPTNNVRLRFSVADNPNNSICESALDDVTVAVKECNSPPLIGDINGDGVVGQEDLGILLAAFNTCEGDPNYNPAANIAPGPSPQCIDQSDLGVLLANYGKTGCP